MVVRFTLPRKRTQIRSVTAVLLAARLVRVLPLLLKRPPFPCTILFILLYCSHRLHRECPPSDDNFATATAATITAAAALVPPLSLF